MLTIINGFTWSPGDCPSVFSFGSINIIINAYLAQLSKRLRHCMEGFYCRDAILVIISITLRPFNNPDPGALCQSIQLNIDKN